MSASLSAAAVLFSSRLKIAAMRSLLRHGPATRSELARRLEVRPSSLQDHLASLTSLGLVSTDPPAVEPGPITRTYHADGAQLRALLEAISLDIFR